jgi:hypothetical protein
MRPALVLWGLVTLVALVVTLGAGYLVVRGPFLGGPLLAPTRLLVATGLFVLGLVALALGGSKVARAR